MARHPIRLLWLIVCMLVVAGTVRAQSEEEAFRRIDRDESGIEIPGQPIGEIALALSFDYISGTRYRTDFLDSAADDVATIGPTLQGFVKIAGNLGLSFQVPYRLDATLEEHPGNLPGISDYEFRTNDGMGDVVVGLSDLFVTDWSTPLALRLHADAIAPTGMSRFDPDYPGYLPLGNGFWGLSSEASAELYLSSDAWLLGSYGRFDRQERDFAIDGSDASLTLKPGAITRAECGLALRMLKDLAVVLDLEAIEAAGVTQIAGGQEQEFEAPYRVERMGLKFIDPRPNGSSIRIFLGRETIEGQSVYLFSFSMPTGVKLLRAKL